MYRFVLCGLALLALFGEAAADRPPPIGNTPATPKSAYDPSRPLSFKQGGDILWLQVYDNNDACPCGPLHGGECTGGPNERETFCFERYVPGTADSLYKYYGSPGTPFFSPSSGNGFRTADVRTYPAPDDRFYWHLDTYHAYSGYSWWCGTSAGTICNDWDNAPGYGDDWRQSLVLDPDLPGISAGDTVRISCQVRYDVECDYDYAYLSYSNNAGTSWSTLAVFNGSSGSPSGSPCGVDYFGNNDYNQGSPSWQYFPTTPQDGEVIVTSPDDFRIAFRFESDGAWSDEDGRGDTDGAFYVDNVIVESTSFGGGILEVEDMDGNFEPAKWSLARPPGIADHWWMPYDPDPPREPGDAGGADVCWADASWQWCAIPHVYGRWRIPPESNGFFYRLMTPRIYLGWGEPTIPKPYAGLICQYDAYAEWSTLLCDAMDTSYRLYRADKNAWCGWKRFYTWWWDPPDDWIFDSDLEVYDLDPATVDSVQFAWDIWDTGTTGDWCWTTQNPAPHQKTRLIVDNVSFGLYDQSATYFYARTIDLFQDTFDLQTDAHNALCANGDMPKALAGQESLTVDISDINGLSGPGSWVRLYFSDDWGASWNSNAMRLDQPNPEYPETGGTYRGSIAASEVPSSAGGVWTPGTEIWYYIEVKDDNGNLAYWPATAAPPVPRPSRPYYNNYLEFSVLPGVAALPRPNRILFVDDYGRSLPDFHPCRSESSLCQTEDLYEGLLWDLGFGFDKYDVGGPISGLSNQPWGVVDYPQPDSVVRRYDCVIWSSGRFDYHTLSDTMQCRLVEFVREGGHLLICGNGIGVDMTSYGSYGAAAAESCSFYGGLLGARMTPPGYSARGILNPDYYAKGTGAEMSNLDESDVFHFYLGCPVNAQHDRILINDSPPGWAPNPEPYLTYESENTYDPGDTVVAVYNEIVDGGNVVYLSFDLAAMVDSSAVICDRLYQGRYEILRDAICTLFGLAPVMTVTAEPEQTWVNALDQNHPNPFNPDTDIEFSVATSGRVTLVLYNVEGRRVRTLVDEALMPGTHRVHWDGTNDDGRAVSTGIYFCRMTAGDFRATRKMVMLK